MTDHRGTQKDEKQKQEGINIGSRTNMGTRQNQRDHTHMGQDQGDRKDDKY